MMSKKVKCCFNCIFFYYDEGSGAYSEYTPENPTYFDCHANVWDGKYHDKNLIEKLCLGFNCKKYKEKK